MLPADVHLLRAAMERDRARIPLPVVGVEGRLIDAATQGGPGRATTILVYKVYYDGFKGMDLGSSAAQSVVLMVIVITLTVVQFRYVEKRVQY